MYEICGEKLVRRPEVRIGDRIFEIDNRLSTFERINERLKNRDGDGDFEIIIGEALGLAVYRELREMDLAYGVMYEIVIVILAAIQDLSVEEARARFRGQGEAG